MSVFIPVVGEQPRHARPRPDLRLAESYIPALMLYLKCIGYTCIAPIILLMQWRLTVLSVAAFALLLYVDHLYLGYGAHPFIDTTALCLDVFGATLLMLAISLLRPCSQQCQAVLGIWTLLGFVHVLFAQRVPRLLAHASTFVLALLFVYADAGGFIAPSSSANVTQTSVIATTGSLLPLPFSFFSRTTLYVLLGLVDIYLFRPLFQQENERLLFCKYAPVLLGTWPWYIVFGLFLATAQVAKHWGLLKLAGVASTWQQGASNSSSTSATTASSYSNGSNNSSNGGGGSYAHMFHGNSGGGGGSNAEQQSSSSSSLLLLSAQQPPPPLSACGNNHGHNSHSSHAPLFTSGAGVKSIQDMDIMEAFRLAKEQRMGPKGAN
jgi:hypothetical protein